MTWEELEARIKSMDEKQKKTTVTAYDCDSDDFYGTVTSIEFSISTDAVDQKYPFLMVDSP